MLRLAPDVKVLQPSQRLDDDQILPGLVPRMLSEGQSRQHLVLAGLPLKVERSEVARQVRRGSCWIGDNLRQVLGRPGGARAPNDVAAGGGVPVLAGGLPPGVKVRVPLAVGAD